MKFSSTVGLALAGAVAVHGAKSFGTPVAVIADGVILGTTTSLPAATAPVNKYLGIPFAEIPVKRFAPPGPAVPWKQPLNASSFGARCIQSNTNTLLSGAVVAGQIPESEDCLFLNVFQPGGTPPQDGWPVLFWIYGGGLQFGSADIAYYDGSSFASYEDVIVVSFNYRLNVFGFPDSPELALNQTNLGYLDQRQALQWVRDNIESFNGDPEKVTIFGESAGSISVEALITAPPKNNLFRGAIMESGSIIGNTLSNIGSNVTKTWLSLVEGVNCSFSASPLACVSALPALTIQSYIQNHSLSFAPVDDNTTFISKSSQSRSSGRAAKVPLLGGTNANEGTLFTFGQNNLSAFVNTAFGALPDLASQVLTAYAVGSPGIANDSQAIAQLFTEVGLQCTQALVANQSVAMNIPTWTYYYNATFPNLLPLPRLGVYHASEIPIVFGTYPTVGATAQQAALSQFMRGAWGRFARNPMAGPGWNAVGTFNGTDLGVLGTAGSSGVTVISPARLNARCELFKGLYSLLS